MRVALYARASKRDSRQETENQLAQLREFAQAQKWDIVHEYIERATGKHSDREQFQRLFEDASKRKFHLVQFWSLDRFSREGVRETLNLSFANNSSMTNTLCRNAFISVMKAAELWNCDNLSHLQRLSRERAFLIEA